MKGLIPISVLIAVIVLVLVLPFMWSMCQNSTSTYWQTEAVKRGFATWETTTDGQVWFRWKEELL